jgi:DNA-binding NtrC family response regulator
MTDEGAQGGSKKDLKTLLEEYERSLVQAALAASHGNQRRAAAALGVLPTTLHEKLKRLGLHPSVQPPPVTSHLEAQPETLA